MVRAGVGGSINVVLQKPLFGNLGGEESVILRELDKLHCNDYTQLASRYEKGGPLP